MVFKTVLPVAQGGPRNGAGVVVSFPAPVKGLNTRESFAQLGPDEAATLENWLPDVGSCRVRPGYEDFATIDGDAAVKTLARYDGGSTSSLIAASNGALWDVASGTPSSLASGYSEDLWSTEFSNGYLFGVNGTDTPWRFDGSTVSDTGFTGPTISHLRTVKLVQNKLWFTIANSGQVYYSQNLAVTGPLTLFDLPQIAEGGTCMGVFPWRDATVFCMSTGQVLVYEGDPQTNFTIISKYYAPPLIEPDAAVKMGAELVLLTTSGPISMDIISAGLGFNLQALGDWGKIGPSWQSDFKTFGTNKGWFGKFIDGLVYFNVATGAPVTKQYVFNTRNQVWTTYSNLPIASMEVLDGIIYLGSSAADGNVYEHAGGFDGSDQIVTLALPGFSYLDNPAQAKLVSSLKPNIFSSGIVNGQFQVDSDFMAAEINSAVVSISAGGATVPWDSAWDTDWSESVNNKPLWLSRSGYGRAIRPVVRTFSSADEVEWFSTDMLVTMGGSL